MPVFDIWGTYEIQQVKKRTWPSLITNKFAKQTKRGGRRRRAMHAAVDARTAMDNCGRLGGDLP
jgi:ribosomal protein S3